MDMDVLARIEENLHLRASGPLHLRLLMQPAMACFLALRDGFKDARNDKPAYFWSLLTSPGNLSELLRDAVTSLAKLLLMAVALDAIFQFVALHAFYPGEAILVALLLAFIPYILLRGPANRAKRWWGDRQRTKGLDRHDERTKRAA
jgi:hypothetical protein